ncbi:complex I subunit 5 family protein [Desulfobaculum bizertense]|uniref:Multisubunit sodium/proton antiporter, MrpD subunit n=1 Tax=Desulfobaculum bizertense DSM 18034 TaxID=1121442 RepID=A0A1T4W7D0_9BACT|nr:proton-conducting transporter membrane subunit [Desulfobaculum bizertense]UIJ39130.1 monovalent cation/H+ antiporter subunit D family protein [Desulfobaculum bizertense]SKA73183.1 multisubunit sodium/proton antiporter, MrpD subunit [Desulfobaculum bizertense DSM 18034]
MNQYPALIVIAPLLSALVVAIGGWFNRRIYFPVAVAALGVSVCSALGLLIQVMATGPFSYRLGGWMPPFGIEYYIDYLSALVLLLMTSIGLLNLIATRRDVERTYEGKVPVFYTLYLLSVVGHLGLVVTGDAFNLYVLLEITALSGYALLAMGDAKSALSTLRYLFMGTMGASFYLLGVGFLYIMTGSLNMQDLASILPNLYTNPAIIAAFGLIMAGVFTKMAFFPMHAWLPNAYGDAGSPASSLIAPMTTKVMVYVMIRMMLTVFTPDFVFASAVFNEAIVWLAIIAMLAGAAFALAQRDLKRMLTFVLLSEVGYMVGGAWLGNRLGMTGSILHIVNDAAMTLCVFLCAGCIKYRNQSTRFENLPGLFRKQPFTMTALVIGALAMIGVPPTCGFFSKWYLILGGLDAGHYWFVGALILSSLINIVLFFRVFEIAHFEPFTEGHGHGHHDKIHDAPWSMVVPLLVVAAGLIVLGFLSGDIVTHVIDFAIPANIV